MNDLVKKTTEITLKGIAKRVVALFGIPGEVVDIAALIVTKAITNPNDVAAQEAFKKLQEEIVLELAADSKKYKDERPPSIDDVEQGLIRFATNYRRAGSHQKRWILFNALHNSFRPEFYNDGLAQILWSKVEVLEYPDLKFLQDVLSSKGPTIIGPVDLESEFAKRLAAQGLVIIQELDYARRRIDPCAIARKLHDFALEELWNENRTSR